MSAIFYIPVLSWFMTLTYAALVGALTDYHEQVAILGYDILNELCIIFIVNLLVYTAFKIYRRLKCATRSQQTTTE